MFQQKRICNLTKIFPLGDESFYENERRDGTNTLKLAVAWRNSCATARKNGEYNNCVSLQHIYYINLRIYKYLFCVTTYLGNAYVMDAAMAQSVIMIEQLW